MDDVFKIYIHRLTEGRTEKIQEILDPAFMDISEAELSFEQPVFIRGEAELASNTLVLRLKIETEATMPCAVCNRDVQIKVSVQDFCHTEDLPEIKSGIFIFKDVLREAILLELPIKAECSGNCPEREALLGFFASRKKGDEDEYHPFEDIS